MSTQLIDTLVSMGLAKDHQSMPRSNQPRIFLLLLDQPQMMTKTEKLRTTKYERIVLVFGIGHMTTPTQSISEMVTRISEETMQNVDSCPKDMVRIEVTDPVQLLTWSWT